MKKVIPHKTQVGLTLTEILGATAVLMTLATIATLSVKDTVAAGSKASMQRELQQLNTALNNYEAAGGVIPETAVENVQDALDALKSGVELAGDGEFTALEDDPNLSVSLDGEPYNLSYTPDNGFSYTPASGAGAPITGSGGLGTNSGGSGNSTYPFDITSPSAIQEALGVFSNLSEADPARQSYLDAFNAVRDLGTLDDNELQSIGEQLDQSGVYDINQTWVLPDPNYAVPETGDSFWTSMLRNTQLVNPNYKFERAFAGGEAEMNSYVQNNYGSWTNMAMAMHGFPLQHFYNGSTATSSPVTESYVVPTSPEEWAAMTAKLAGPEGKEHFYALRHLQQRQLLPPNWTQNIDWSKLNSLDGFYMRELNLVGSNITADLLSTATVHTRTPLVSGSTPLGIDAPNWRNYSFSNLNLSQLNLSGMNLSGRTLFSTNMSGATGITAAQLAKATDLRGVNLRGTGITKAALEQALIAEGKDPNHFAYLGSYVGNYEQLAGTVYLNKVNGRDPVGPYFDE